jgi:murein DD-endopeptidase MepM/ murein hydrolase activator NlpD
MLARALLLVSLLGLAVPASAVTIYKYTDANGEVGYSDRARPGAQAMVLKDPRDEQLDRQVRLKTLRHETGETLLVSNQSYAPVEMELSLSEVRNVLGAPTEPIRWVLQPRSDIRLLTLMPRDPARRLSYKPRLRYVLGDPRSAPSLEHYPLPWRGGPFRLTQGANGPYSHRNAKGRYAMDVAMPVGTPVVAARDGVVISTENQQTGRGNNPSGNFVRILHDDGTMGVYLHLMRGSLRVREGQRVVAGTPIARSGNTGNSTGPHLHFVVQRNVGLALESIPFRFSQPVDSLPNFAIGGP